MRQNRSLTAFAIAIVGLFVSLAYGQAPAAFPAIDVHVPTQPRPLVAGGRTHLVYELHITNLSTRQTTLDRVDVLDRSSPQNAAPLLRLEGAALDAALRRVGTPPADADRRVLAGGGSVLVFAWVTLPSSRVPASLTHRFTIRVASPVVPIVSNPSAIGNDGQVLTIDGVNVAVNAVRPRVIGPPLRGNHWLAANGPDNGADHRRTLFALAAEGRIAQRFAIDWVRLNNDGRTWEGDPSRNASYRAYGADVLAVADGVVFETHDGIPENVPDPVARAVPMTPDTLGGNYVLLDMGDGAYAFYAHLRPGSLKVKNGDRVHRGQVFALVGNTGNSTEPHLHFHVGDRNSPFDSEGVPYALDSFDLEASSAQVTPAIVPVGNSLGLDSARFAKWMAAPPERRRVELPSINAIVKFHDR